MTSLATKRTGISEDEQMVDLLTEAEQQLEEDQDEFSLGTGEPETNSTPSTSPIASSTEKNDVIEEKWYIVVSSTPNHIDDATGTEASNIDSTTTKRNFKLLNLLTTAQEAENTRNDVLDRRQQAIENGGLVIQEEEILLIPFLLQRKRPQDEFQLTPLTSIGNTTPQQNQDDKSSSLFAPVTSSPSMILQTLRNDIIKAIEDEKENIDYPSKDASRSNSITDTFSYLFSSAKLQTGMQSAQSLFWTGYTKSKEVADEITKSETYQQVTDKVTEVANGIQQSETYKNVSARVSDGFTVISDKTKETVQTVREHEGVQTFSQNVGDGLQSLKQNIGNRFQTLQERVGTTVETVKNSDGFKNVQAKATTVGQNASQEIGKVVEDVRQRIRTISTSQ
eukprot:g529.t1